MPRFKGAGSAAIKPVSSADLEKAKKAAEEKRQQEMLIAEERRKNAEASASTLQQDMSNENGAGAQALQDVPVQEAAAPQQAPVQGDFGNAPAVPQLVQDDFGNAPAISQPVQDDFGNDTVLPPLSSSQPEKAEENAIAADALPGLEVFVQPEEESAYTSYEPMSDSQPKEVPEQTVKVNLNRFEEPEVSQKPEETAFPPIVTPELAFTQEAEPVQAAAPAAAQRVRPAAPPPAKATFSLNASLFEVEDEETQQEVPEVQSFVHGLENLVMDFYDPDTVELPVVSADLYCSLPHGTGKHVKPEAWVQACESLHTVSSHSLQKALTEWIDPHKALLNGPRILSPQGTERYGLSEMVQDERVITYLQELELQLWKDTLYRADGTEAPSWIHHTWLTKLLDYMVDYYMSTMR